MINAFYPNSTAQNPVSYTHGKVDKEIKLTGSVA